MINKKILDAILRTAENNNKNLVISEIFKHISLNYDYNDLRANHVLEMLVDANAIISVDDINMDYILKNLKDFIYSYEEYNIKDVTVGEIDNIDCIVKINYNYLEKINEDRDDVSYKSGYVNISFIDNPKILIK